MATLEELNKLKNDLDFHIHQAATSEQRKQVLALETKISEDHKRVAELRSLAYEISVKNKPEIERLKLETARLISQSIEMDNESVMLQHAMRAKHQELADLRRQIEVAKNPV